MRMQIFEKSIEVEGNFQMREIVSILHLKLLKVYPDVVMFIWGGKFNWCYKFIMPINDEKKMQAVISNYERIDRIRYNRFWIEYTKKLLGGNV